MPQLAHCFSTYVVNQISFKIFQSVENKKVIFSFILGFWKLRTFDNRGRYQVEILWNSGICSAPARGFIDETWMKQRRRRESWHKKRAAIWMYVPLKQLPSEASSSFFLLYTQSQWSFGRWFGHSQSWPQKKVWPNKLLKNCPATTDHGHAKTYVHLWNSKLGIYFIFYGMLEPWGFQFEYSISRV